MRSHAAFRAGAAGLLVLALAGPAAADDWKTLPDNDWCREGRNHSRYCEVREIEVAAGRDLIRVDAGPNGGVEVEGWDRDRILIRAKITVWDDDDWDRDDRDDRDGEDRDGAEIAGAIRIDTGGEIHATGPDARHGRGWSVSYRLLVPRESDLELETRNGGLEVVGVSGTIDLSTTNGGIGLARVGGNVTGRTTNGGVSVALEGSSWQGEGLDVESRNGGIHLEVPRDYSARVLAGTRNGGIRSDIPVRREDRHGNEVRATLGDGGALIRVVTRNGGVRIEET